VLRTFIAADVASTPALLRLLDRLQELGDRFRPVKPDDLHVTLKFLGDTSESDIGVVGAVVKRVIESRAAFHVRLAGVGTFPNAHRPAVVWVGLDPAESLRQIAGVLDNDLSGLGFPSEQRLFIPHLTLLRVKMHPPEALYSLLAEESQSDFGMVEISRVHLYRSELTRSGPRYTQLETAVLSK
jgi:2'-5' RNA ligase